MVPPKTHPRYRQLVTGEFSPSFQAFAFSMCVSRNKRQVEHEGKSPASISTAIEDIYAFVVKFEAVLEADLKAIFQ